MFTKAVRQFILSIFGIYSPNENLVVLCPTITKAFKPTNFRQEVAQIDKLPHTMYTTAFKPLVLKF